MPNELVVVAFYTENESNASKMEVKAEAIQLKGVIDLQVREVGEFEEDAALVILDFDGIHSITSAELVKRAVSRFPEKDAPIMLVSWNTEAGILSKIVEFFSRDHDGRKFLAVIGRSHITKVNYLESLIRRFLKTLEN